MKNKILDFVLYGVALASMASCSLTRSPQHNKDIKAERYERNHLHQWLSEAQTYDDSTAVLDAASKHISRDELADKGRAGWKYPYINGGTNNVWYKTWFKTWPLDKKKNPPMRDPRWTQPGDTTNKYEVTMTDVDPKLVEPPRFDYRPKKRIYKTTKRHNDTLTMGLVMVSWDNENDIEDRAYSASCAFDEYKVDEKGNRTKLRDGTYTTALSLRGIEIANDMAEFQRTGVLDRICNDVDGKLNSPGGAETLMAEIFSGRLLTKFGFRTTGEERLYDANGKQIDDIKLPVGDPLAKKLQRKYDSTYGVGDYSVNSAAGADKPSAGYQSPPEKDVKSNQQNEKPPAAATSLSDSATQNQVNLSIAYLDSSGNEVPKLKAVRTQWTLWMRDPNTEEQATVTGDNKSDTIVVSSSTSHKPHSIPGFKCPDKSAILNDWGAEANGIIGIPTQIKKLEKAKKAGDLLFQFR